MTVHPIPLVDLRAQYAAIKEEMDHAVRSVLERGEYILGSEGTAFEQEMATSCGTSEAVGVASGTDALELSLRAYGIGPGDEVILPAFSFIATASAIVLAGATPVFVDIEPRTFTIDPTRIPSLITPRTKAIIPVHLYGHPCQIERICAIAASSGLKVIEDCAQAIGATSNGRRVGSIGHAGALSFYPSKNLGAYGDGGMVVTNDATLADRLRLLRSHGSRDRTQAQCLGKNSRLDELQAAILRVKLRHLEAWNAARRDHAQTYARLCRHYRLLERIRLPQEMPHCSAVYHLYSIGVANRNRVRDALVKQGIGAQIYYPSTLPEQPILQAFVPPNRAFPIAEAAAREMLSLPMYPELTPELIEEVVRALAQEVLR
jgi:dTDP-4-amino-4,6-dideoxygalactose transaminase